MKRIATFILLASVLITVHSNAQGTFTPGKTFSIATSAGIHGFDSGVGLEVGTPCFKNTSLCLRIKGTVSWLEWYKATFDHWARYESFNVSMVYNIFTVERSRGYVEMGTYLVFPDEQFSQRKSIQGITSSLGIELFVVTKPGFHLCYYFSSGIGYIKAYADKLENKPRYGNGFVFNNGFRFYF